MDKTKIKAEFWYQSFNDFDTDIITEIMNINPNRVAHKGEPLGRGTFLRRYTSWSISTGYKETLDISEQVSALTEILYQREHQILHIKKMFDLECSLPIYLKIERGEYPRISLDSKLISFIHRMGMEIGFDIYDFS